MTPNEHYDCAVELMAESRRLRRRSFNRDAAGSDTRARWRVEADVLLAEAQVHATLATFDPSRAERVIHRQFAKETR